MADGLAPAPRERGWARLAFALAAFLLVPLFPAVRAVLPVEHTLILLVPTVAVCFLLGWWAGGRLSLALVWLAFAAWVLATFPDSRVVEEETQTDVTDRARSDPAYLFE